MSKSTKTNLAINVNDMPFSSEATDIPLTSYFNEYTSTVPYSGMYEFSWIGLKNTTTQQTQQLYRMFGTSASHTWTVMQKSALPGSATPYTYKKYLKAGNLFGKLDLRSPTLSSGKESGSYVTYGGSGAGVYWQSESLTVKCYKYQG